MAPLRICFAHCANSAFAETQMFGIHFMPVWAYTLAAHTEDIPGLELSLFDDRFEPLSTLPAADLYLFTGINQDLAAIETVLAEVRKKHPKALAAIGGPITWSFNTAGKLQHLDAFDHIFLGDGEENLRVFLENHLAGKTSPKIVRATGRFALGQAKPMSRRLLDTTYQRYYGAVVEVSRGCPFLCEFCDIRTLPDNNRSHVKDPALIVQEVAHLAELGVRQILFACDNFIGNTKWAEDVCDHLIAWLESSGAKISLYTWLTINLGAHPRLLRKLRLAGFDLFFIGVESFNPSSLRETAKVQNTTVQLAETLRAIQAYGFIVVAGLIFGFDTDPDTITDIMLDGIVASGLISGDPSLLMALPGTPLYKRMQLSNRLRDMKFNLGGFKYQTNILYLRPAERMRADFQHFVDVFTSPGYQRKRLESFYSCLDTGHYLPPLSAGYADLPRLLRMTFRKWRPMVQLTRRMALLFGNRERFRTIASAFWLTWQKTSAERPLWFYFKFWLFNWSNSLVKYSSLQESDFDLQSVPADFSMDDLLPKDYDSAHEPIPNIKIKNQRRLTSAALREFVKSRT